MARKSKRLKLKGFDEYQLKIKKLKENGDRVAKEALYQGAGIMADALRASIEALPSVKDTYNLKAYKKGFKYRLSDTQKEGLIDGMGISSFEENGDYIDVKIGFEGYNDIKTKKYPKGQPNPLIARVLESGSSYMNKTPFIRNTTSKNKKKVEKTMADVIDNEFNKIMKG